MKLLASESEVAGTTDFPTLLAHVGLKPDGAVWLLFQFRSRQYSASPYLRWASRENHVENTRILAGRF